MGNSVTLPHEREHSAIDDMIDDCLKGRNKLIVVVCDSYQRVSWFSNEAHKAAESLIPTIARQIRIYREGLEFENGAKIVFQAINTPSFLRGLKPDRIVVMGIHAEFWYLAMASGATIEAVA